MDFIDENCVIFDAEEVRAQIVVRVTAPSGVHVAD